MLRSRSAVSFALPLFASFGLLVGACRGETVRSTDDTTTPPDGASSGQASSSGTSGGGTSSGLSSSGNDDGTSGDLGSSGTSGTTSDVDQVALTCGAGAKIVEIVSGGSDHCALLDSGAVKCWGANTAGGLGLGDKDERGSKPGQMGAALRAVDLAGVKAKHVAAGSGFTCAVLETNEVKCWGVNNWGQLGQGSIRDRGDEDGEMGANLASVNLGTTDAIVQIVAGDVHACVLYVTGQVKCWGESDFGQLGQGDQRNRGGTGDAMGATLSYVPLGSTKVVALSAGGVDTCALFENKKAKCWGGNLQGTLGTGDPYDRGDDNGGPMGDQLPFIDLGEDVVQVVAGSNHNCALLASGAVKCWGENYSGQLGQGDTTARGQVSDDMHELHPIALGTGGGVIKEIVAGWNVTCARYDTGNVKCWGAGNYGQVGQGARENLGDDPHEMGDALPFIDLGGRKITKLTAGSSVCALTDNARATCWGDGFYGQLGSGSEDTVGIAPHEMGHSLPCVDLGP